MTINKVKYDIVVGIPTAEEEAAIEFAMSHHKHEDLKPVVKRSVWARPILRSTLPQQIKFGSGRNN
jgi:glutamine phosphoribosylpyrophosphate amidotransferase